MKNKAKFKESISPKKHYSESFKIKVVREVEQGNLSKDGARRKYGIGGKSAVLSWCRKYGRKDWEYPIMPRKKKNKELSPDEKDRRIEELESQLAQSQLSVDALEALIEVTNEIYQTDIKKKVGIKRSKE